MKKSTNYKTRDSGGWMHACDDLFLAQFRGKPCEICGERQGMYNNRTIRSMGHHLLSKELHRLYRYKKNNIIILCPNHHLGVDLSPHSHDGVSQALFYKWLWEHKHERFSMMIDRKNDTFEGEWCYRDMYQYLGGVVKTMTGKKKDMRPYKHSAAVKRAEA